MPKFIRYACNALFTISFALALFRLLQVTTEKYLFAAVFLIPFLLLALYVFPCKVHVKKKHFQWLTYQRAWLFVQIPGICVIIAAFLTNRVEPGWDWGTSITIAIQYVTTGTTSAMSYVATYSNNQFWIFALICFFKIIKAIIPSAETAIFQTALWILNAILAITAVNFIYAGAKLLLSEKKAFFTGALAALFLPIYLYVQITYTDIPGMFLCSLLFYLYCRIQKAEGREKYVLLVLLGITAAVSYRIKVIVFIFFIAITLVGIFNIKKLRKSCISGGIVAAFFLLAFLLTGECMSYTLKVPEEATEEYRFPLSHWVMMGLKGNGGYNAKDYAYTISIPGYQAKVDATIAKIQKRVHNKGVSGMINLWFNKKIRRTWGNCMLSSDAYYMQDDLEEKTLFQKLMYKDGSYSLVVRIIMSLYYCMILTGIVFSGIASMLKYPAGKPSTVTFTCRLALLGFFLFELIWECNSRYILCLAPVIFMVSGDGLYEIISFFRRSEKKEMKENGGSVGNRGSMLQ